MSMAFNELQMAVQDLRTAQRYARTALKTLESTSEGNAYSGEVEGVVTQIDETIAILEGK